MSKKIKTIEDIAAWQLCCGCGACSYISPEQIEMIDVLEYGRRPCFKSQSDISAAKETMQVCPGIDLAREPKPVSQLGDDSFYDVWGPILNVWEGHASDEQIRFEGASGGIATALSLYAMEKLNMYGTLHIAPRQDVPYLNQTVLSRKKEQFLAGAGSRYAPASPCDGLQQVEDAGGPCVFIGKPCDVAAVRKAMLLRPKLTDRLGLTIAFFCAGTPATRGTLEMLQQMGIVDPNSVVSLRYRGRGWPGMATVEYRNGDGKIQQRQLTYEQSWGDILQKYRQWRCYICPDHIGEYADITVADAWHRTAADHQPGRSVIIARTQRGRQLFEQAVQDGFIRAETVDLDILPDCRPGQAAYQGALWARLQTLRLMGIPAPTYQEFDLFRLWRAELSIKEKVRSIPSTIKRVFVKKLYKPRKISFFASYCPARDD
jgi:coenzyme F420 hydrogenase subunit beta